MSETTCVLCPVYYPGAELHAPDRSQTCDVGRRRLERDRLSVLSMYRRLVEQEEEIADRRVSEQTGQPLDPIAAALPMAPTPSPSKAPAVTGSRERQIPINVTVVDLTAPARPGAVSDPWGDQVGHLSVATVLYEWVQHWRDPHGSTTPVTTERLMKWLAPRIERIADLDPAIVDFAAELIELKGHLRHALGESAPKPVVMWGVPCRRCNAVSTLVLDQEDPNRYRECSAPSCGVLMTEVEYKEWLVKIVENLREDRGLHEGASV